MLFFRNPRHLEDGAILLLVFIALWRLWSLVRRREIVRTSLFRRSIIDLTALAVAAWMVAGFATHYVRFDRFIPLPISYALGAGSMLMGVCLVGTAAGVQFWRAIPAHSIERRRFLKAARAATIAAPAVVTAFGILRRRDFELNHVRVPMQGLPKDLDGLRLVQLSDIHMSPWLGAADVRYVVDMANETKAHVALVTGDLITRRGDPLDACLNELKRLRADAGVLGCLGNHENYAESEDYTTRKGAEFGLDFLRHRNRDLRFGDAVVNFGGVDYQRMKFPYLIGAESLLSPRANLNVLLQHNPDVFPVAAGQGWDLTLAGHTHGGQVTVEILSQYLNIARFYTPYVSGLYRQGRSTIYVNRGIGTIGLPARIGVRPEVALLELCAI